MPSMGHAGRPNTLCFSPLIAMLVAPTASWCSILCSVGQKARRKILDPFVLAGASTLYRSHLAVSRFSQVCRRNADYVRISLRLSIAAALAGAHTACKCLAGSDDEGPYTTATELDLELPQDRRSAARSGSSRRADHGSLPDVEQDRPRRSIAVRSAEQMSSKLGSTARLFGRRSEPRPLLLLSTRLR